MNKIIIVGAGLAGLTAAYRLCQQGYDVQIFEANQRVGGRVHSVYIQNFDGDYSVAELGGQNITDGGDAENFLRLCQELNIPVIDYFIDFTSLFFDGANYHDTWSLRNLQFTAEYVTELVATLSSTCQSMQEVIDFALKDKALLKRLFTIMLTAYEGSPPHLLSTYHHIDTFKYMLLGGLSSAHETDMRKEPLHMQSIKNGNAELPQKLADFLGDRVHLNKKLQKISRNLHHQLILHFSDGTQEIADKLILAIPASLYADIDFTESSIPEMQLHDIRKIQYGKNAKILTPIQYKHLTHNFIINDQMASFFNADKKLLNLYFINDDASYHFKDQPYKNALAILQNGYQTATFADKSPEIADEELFKKYQAPVAKSWVASPYARGSYSNYGVGQDEVSKIIISYKNIPIKTAFHPVNDQIFFIGEHTSTISEIGTMEAAVESAETIVRLLMTILRVNCS